MQVQQQGLHLACLLHVRKASCDCGVEIDHPRCHCQSVKGGIQILSIRMYQLCIPHKLFRLGWREVKTQLLKITFYTCSVIQYHTQSEKNMHHSETTANVYHQKIPFQVQNTANVLGFCYIAPRAVSAPNVCRFSVLTIIHNCFSCCIMGQLE